ncbi:sensor histidine kinase [Streptomyces niveus]|uniref:Histidine kinase n=1 Tax=Streptomyces niveus TaxID=193462 RepID=A0ABZ2A0Y8_STRNV|nr:histidine kinase [Streptomyces niveus]
MGAFESPELVYHLDLDQLTASDREHGVGSLRGKAPAGSAAGDGAEDIVEASRNGPQFPEAPGVMRPAEQLAEVLPQAWTCVDSTGSDALPVVASHHVRAMTFLTAMHDVVSLVYRKTSTDTGRTMSEFTEATSKGRLRRLNLITLLPVIAVSGVYLVALDSESWSDVVVLGLGVAATLVAFVSWAAGTLARVAVPCLIITSGVWLFGVLAAGSGKAIFGLSIVGPLVVPQLRRHREAAAVTLVTYVAVVGAARFLMTDDDPRQVLIRYVIVPAGVTAIVTGLMFPNKKFYDVVHELEESHRHEAELAVVRERMRFASDLHDIQGHTLHVVKLKVALAQKLLHRDPGRAEQELREIRSLVSDTITQTKELVYAQRRLNLPAELENAKNLFEAAGIQVHIRRVADVDSRAGELLGQVLRETTTNILRHAQAREVRITLSESGITIVNDGVPDTPLPELSGLAVLGQRVADNGGKLTVDQKDGHFLTVADFPSPGPEAEEAR